MYEILADGGPFAILTNVLGLTALALNVARISSRGRAMSIRPVVAVIAATFFLGFAGWSMGLYQAGMHLSAAELPPEEAARLWHMAMGIAQIPNAFAAAWCTLNAALLAFSRDAAE